MSRSAALAAIPERLQVGAPVPGATPVVAVRGAVRHYPARRTHGAPVRALDGVDLVVQPGDSIALVGVSGAGKSTLTRAILGVEPLDAGTVEIAGRDLSTLDRPGRRAALRAVGAIFQDVYGALPPHRVVSDVVAEPLEIHGIRGAAARTRVARLLDEVGLGDPRYLGRLPGQLSGGERQRVALARALALEPAVLVADEPTSMLDVSHQAGLVAMIRRLCDRHGLAVLYVTHDLALAASLCERIVVMDEGRIVEMGSAREVVGHPRHPATVALVEAVLALRAAGAVGSGATLPVD